MRTARERCARPDVYEAYALLYAQPVAADTTVRVSAATRDEIASLAQERGLTADDVVSLGVKALREQEWRRAAEQEALALAHDAGYQELVAETQRLFEQADGSDAAGDQATSSAG